MADRSNTFVPYKFYTGDRLNPDHLNANAIALDSAARWLLKHRYNYFTIQLPFGRTPASVNAEWEKFRFATLSSERYELLSAALHVQNHDAAVSLESDLAGFTSVSCASTANHAIASQNLVMSPSTSFQFYLTNAATTEINAYAELLCRYDRFYGVSGLDLPTVPRVKANDTRSATEWNTWYQALVTALQTLETNWPYARRLELRSIGTPAGMGTITGGGNYSYLISTSRDDYLTGAEIHCVNLTSAPGSYLYHSLYDNSIPNYLFLTEQQELTGTGYVGPATAVLDIQTVSGSSQSQYYVIASTGGNVARAYTALHWRGK